MKGETAIFQPKVEHWDGSRELQFESILSAHSALCAMLQDKPLHGDRYTCHFFYMHSTVYVLLVLRALCHSLTLLAIFFHTYFILSTVKLTIPYLYHTSAILCFPGEYKMISSLHFIHFGGAFEKLRKTTISFVVSACPSVRPSVCLSARTIF